MYKVISCGIFEPYIALLDINQKEYVFTYLAIQQHNYPEQLARSIQEEIDKSQGYEKIIILYGLCGGALLHIHTHKIPIVLVQVHDCLSVLLGSKQNSEDVLNGNKSISWSCYSLKKDNHVNEQVLEWENQYDQETIDYLKQYLMPRTEFYISFHLLEEMEFEKEEKNIVKGDLFFLYRILTLQSPDIITLFEGEKIKQTADQYVFRKEKIHR